MGSQLTQRHVTRWPVPQFAPIWSLAIKPIAIVKQAANMRLSKPKINQGNKMLSEEKLKEAARKKATHYRADSASITLYKVTDRSNGLFKVHRMHGTAWLLMVNDAIEVPEYLKPLNFDALITDAMLLDVASCLSGMMDNKGRWEPSQHIRKLLTF